MVKSAIILSFLIIIFSAAVFGQKLKGKFCYISIGGECITFLDNKKFEYHSIQCYSYEEGEGTYLLRKGILTLQFKRYLLRSGFDDYIKDSSKRMSKVIEQTSTEPAYIRTFKIKYIKRKKILLDPWHEETKEDEIGEPPYYYTYEKGTTTTRKRKKLMKGFMNIDYNFYEP